LLPEFERTSGIKVATGSGASQGTGPQTIAAQLARTNGSFAPKPDLPQMCLAS
jgi:hypothetical protein